MVADSQLELMTKEIAHKPTNSIAHYSHDHGIKRFYRREPTISDLHSLLATIQNAAGGVMFTQFGISVRAAGLEHFDDRESFTSLDALERYLSIAENHGAYIISPLASDRTVASFACNDFPCEGRIYMPDYLSNRGRKEAVQFLGDVVMAPVGALMGVAGVLGSILGSMAARDPTYLLLVPSGVAVGGSLVAGGDILDANTRRDPLKVDLFYTGPAEKKSPEREAYASLVRDMQNFKL